MERAVITGLGIITCAGRGKEAFWERVTEGRSGITELSLFDTSNYRSRFGGEVQELAPDIPDRAWQLLLIAAMEALEDAKLDLFEVDEAKLQIILGTAHGDLASWKVFYDAIQPDQGGEIRHPQFAPWDLTKRLAQTLQLNCYTNTIAAACTASTIALGRALQKIRQKEIDLALVAGVDCLSEFIFAGFDSLRALSPSSCRPFDRERDGLVLGEGGAVLIIESLSGARKRKANIYAELAGFGTYCDAVHLTAPDKNGRGATLSLERALNDANLKPADVSYINAHGTGTNYNDRMECVAIKKVFQEQAAEIPISSIKPVIGHTSGASGAIEAVLCGLCLQRNMIPPTINFRTPLADFGFDFVPNTCRAVTVETAVSMNSAFGGSNACLVLRSVGDER